MLAWNAGQYANAAAQTVGAGYSTPATQFFSRITDPGTTRKNLYAALIDGLVADGVWSLLDALWLHASDIVATAKVNLTSSSYLCTQYGTVTFTADRGIAGDGSTGYFATGFIPSSAGGNYALNSASYGVYDRTSSTASDALTQIGAQDSSNNRSFLLLNWTGLIADINASGLGSAITNSQHQGSWALSRTTSSLTTVYKNGSAFGTNTPASAALTTVQFYICARNLSNAGYGYSTDQLAASWIGGGFTTTQLAALQARINTYMTGIGANVY